MATSTYTQSTNTDPSKAVFGEESPGVLKLQAAYNQANAGTPNFTPLKIDGIYGPMTQAALAGGAPKNNQLIVTGTKPSQQFSQYQQDLTRAVNQPVYTPPQPGQPDSTGKVPVPGATPTADGGSIESPYAGMQSYSDPYTQQLDKIAATGDKVTQNLIATIKAQKANRMNTLNQETDRLKQGLMSLGLSTGNINFTPDLVYGSIAQAENARAQKLQELDQNEATALLEATQASEDQDLDLLKEKMDYYKSIKKSRLDILKESYDTMATEAKIGELQAFQIYDELQKMPTAKKLPFLQQISTQFNIPLTALTSQVNELTRDRAKKASTGGGSSGTSVKSAIAELKGGTFNKSSSHSIIGKDAYVDPYAYIRAFEAFPGTNKEWLANFPVSGTGGLVNPASYGLLPEALRPKVKATGITIEDI